MINLNYYQIFSSYLVVNTLRLHYKTRYAVMLVDPCIIVQFIKKNPTRCKQCIKILLFYIYVKLNMFRATHRPSSGA